MATSLGGFDNPTKALFDPSGDLWVVDSSNSRVLEFEPPFRNGMGATLVIGANTSEQVPAGSNTLWTPYGAAFDSSGNLWVSDQGNGRILEFVPPFVNGMRASIVIGQSSFTSVCMVCQGQGGPSMDTRSGLTSPSSIAFDSSGNLWVADDDARVLEYNPPFVNGMNASVVLGQPDFDTVLRSSTLHGLAAQAYYESGLAIDSSNDVWVGDPGNNRILEFRPPFSNGMNATFAMNQNSLISNKFSPNYNLGTTVVFDSRDNLWATYNDKLLAFKPPFSPEIRAFPAVELGQPNITSIASLVGQAGFFGPGDAAFDSHGNLWIPDTNNNRVLEFVANSGVDVAGQTPTNPTPTELAIVSAAAVGIAGVSIAFWLNRRMHKHPSAHQSPV